MKPQAKEIEQMSHEKVVSLVQYDVNRFQDSDGPQEDWEMDGMTTFTEVVAAYKTLHPEDAEAIERFSAFALSVAGVGLEDELPSSAGMQR
jgi:alpha-ketoglutarate-dependent taurine dioxygenase